MNEMDAERRRKTEFRSWLFLTAIMAPVLAVLIVSGYGSFGSKRWRESGSAVFRCNVVMPDGATVTAVSFSVDDSSATGEFEGGALFATNLVTSIGSEVSMAGVGGTGIAATPGNAILTDTSISSPVVDNGSASYTALAILNGTTQAVGLWGMTVTYSVPGFPEP